MRKTILATSVTLLLATSLSMAIPVIDAPQLYENGQTVIRWTQQIKQWETEMKQWKKQYDAITGFKLEGDVLDKLTQINNILEAHGLDMTDLDLNNPKSQIGVLTKQLFDDFLGFFDDCKYEFMTDGQKRRCRDNIVREVQKQVAVKEIATNVEKTLKKLNDLNEQLSRAKDIKTSQDITTAIESSFASLEIMSSQLEMMVMKNDAQKRLDKRRAKQEMMKKFEYEREYIKERAQKARENKAKARSLPSTFSDEGRI